LRRSDCWQGGRDEGCGGGLKDWRFGLLFFQTGCAGSLSQCLIEKVMWQFSIGCVES